MPDYFLAQPGWSAVHSFAQDTALYDRPQSSASQRVAKTCVVPAGLYGSQVWSSLSPGRVLVRS